MRRPYDGGLPQGAFVWGVGWLVSVLGEKILLPGVRDAGDRPPVP